MPKIVLTKHALQRARSRKMELYAIEQLILFPENKISVGENKFKFFKNIGERRYQAVASYLKKEDKWLIISVWVKGEEDQLPFVWIIITSPFRLIWWAIKLLWKIIARIAGKK